MTNLILWIFWIVAAVAFVGLLVAVTVAWWDEPELIMPPRC